MCPMHQLRTLLGSGQLLEGGENCELKKQVGEVWPVTLPKPDQVHLNLTEGQIEGHQDGLAIALN